MELVNFLQKHGINLRKQGKSWGSNACPHCSSGEGHSNKLCAFVGKDGKERWFCHACGEKGDLADAIRLLEGVSAVEALRLSRNHLPKTSESPSIESKLAACQTHVEDLSLIMDVITDLQRNLPMWEQEVGQYLINRGISKSTIVDACHKGIIRMLPTNPQAARSLLIKAANGADRLANAGLWAGKSSTWPANAFRPLVFFPAGNTTMEFRHIGKTDPNHPKSIRLGRLTKPFVWRGDVEHVVVVEGAIDMLSLVEMGERRTIMALPGVNSWRADWFIAAHKAYGSKFDIALDNDSAGNKISHTILEFLKEKGIPGQRTAPPSGNDWNDFLLSESKMAA